MVSYDGVTAALLLNTPRFTSSAPRHWSPPKEDDESDDSLTAGSQQREIDGLDVSSFAPFTALEGPEKLEPELSRIYVLGGGNLWKFVAHALAGLPSPPPVTLIFRSGKMLQAWLKSDRSIEIVTDGKGEKRYGYEVEFLARSNRGDSPGTSDNAFREESVLPPEDSPDANQDADYAPGTGIIRQLVLSVRAGKTVSVLSRVAHRLTQNSTIVFMHHGLGIVDEVNKKVFPDEMTRPSYMLGLITHRLLKRPLKEFSVVHSHMGTVALGDPLRRSLLQIRTGNDALSNMMDSNLYLKRTLTRSLDLAAVSFWPIDFFQLQLEKLAVHAVIHPLTVLFDCPNGALQNNGSASRVYSLLVAEISLIIRSLPELQGIPNVEMRFSPKRLVSMIHGIIDSTSKNISPMLRDSRAIRLTDVYYINGYIVRRGEEMGIKCVMNYMVMQMVQAKTSIWRGFMNRSLPVRSLENSEAQ